jgi:hypothetical protein
VAQLRERRADGRLADTEVLGGRGHAAVFMDGHQHRQQVQIEVSRHAALLRPLISDIKSR